ncbi:oligosaccharide flippase family protein [Flavobacterium sp.]
MIKRGITYFKSQKQFHNLTMYGFGQAFNLLTPLLVIPYIVSICGETGYGKIGVGMAVAFFLMVFVDYGSEIIGVKQVAINRENKQNLESIFTTTYSAKALLLAVVIIIFSLIINFIPFFAKEKILFLFSLTMVVGQFINPTWFFQGVENFKWITILNIASKLIYLAGVFIFIQTPEDYILSNLIWGIGMIVANGISFAFIIKKYSFSFRNTDKQKVIRLLKHNFSIFSSQIFVSLQMYSPIVLISFFGNNAMAGQYKIIDQIIAIFKTYLLLFFNYVYPRICYLLEKSKKEALYFWKLYNGINFIFIATSMMGIAFLSLRVVTYFNPKEVEIIADLLKIAVFIPILQAVSIPLKQLVLGENKQREYVRTTMIITTISLLMIILITPFFKVFGVLLALIITEIVTALIYYAIIKNNLFDRSH